MKARVADCESCKVKKACNNLQKGRKYRIVSVRTTHHECPVHLNGATAVEVMEAPITLLISPEMAIVNSKIKPELSCNKTRLPELSSLSARRGCRRREIYCRGCARECPGHLRERPAPEAGGDQTGIIHFFMGGCSTVQVNPETAPGLTLFYGDIPAAR